MKRVLYHPLYFGVQGQGKWLVRSVDLDQLLVSLMPNEVQKDENTKAKKGRKVKQIGKEKPDK